MSDKPMPEVEKWVVGLHDLYELVKQEVAERPKFPVCEIEIQRTEGIVATFTVAAGTSHLSVGRVSFRGKGKYTVASLDCDRKTDVRTSDRDTAFRTIKDFLDVHAPKPA